MQSSAVYHGGGPRGRGNAYAGPPSSAGYEIPFIPAELLTPNPTPGQNNPPIQMVYINPAGQFMHVLSFPQPTLGGAWCRFVYRPRQAIDINVNPRFSVLFTVPAGSGAGVINFQADWGAFSPNDPIGPTGPGTNLTTTSALNDAAQITGDITVPNTSGLPWTNLSYMHCNLYRGAAPPDTVPGPVYVLGVRITLKMA